MKNKYIEQDLNQFFERFKQLPEYFTLEEVHQLINNPHAKATHTVNFNFKHLKIFLMTSACVVGLSTLMWLTPNKTIENISLADINSLKIEVHNLKPETPIPSGKTYSNSLNSNNWTNSISISHENQKNSVIINEKGDSGVLTNNELQKTIMLINTCDWPSDTIINKNKLIVELSDAELKKIGIARNGIASFYHNRTPNGCYDMELSDHKGLIKEEERIITNNEYFVAYHTNLYFEPDAGGKFYMSMDTLVPVILYNQSKEIFWFTPHESFFKSLPERYNYLASVYDNLKCLKKSNPGRTFTNYLGVGSKSILDPVRLLELSKTELINIGIGISDECVTFQSINRKYTLRKCKNSESSKGSDEDFAVFPPNPYPVAMTDTLGRRVYVQSTIIRKDSLSVIMNILIPVKVDLSKFIPGNNEIIICWFYPTEEFLNALPASIKPELKSELIGITGNRNSSTGTCNYFEVCKSTLQIDDLRVYPNPAKNTATLEFNNSQVVTGTVSIVNISGVRLKELLPMKTFIVGHNSYQLDLSGITPGMYLISINTDKGFKTQRIIVSN